MKKSKSKKQIIFEPLYIVEKIIDKKIEKGKPKYLVKWKNYPHSQNTWEPLFHLKNCIYLVEEFEESKKINNELLKTKRNICLDNNDYNKILRKEDQNNRKISLNIKKINRKKEENIFFKKIEDNKSINDLKLGENLSEKIVDSTEKMPSNSILNELPTKKIHSFINDQLKEIEEYNHYMVNPIEPASIEEKNYSTRNKKTDLKDELEESKLFNRLKLQFEDSRIKDSDRAAYFQSRNGELGKDRPKRIINSEILEGELICCIEWIQDNPNEIVLPSKYKNYHIKLIDPFLLLDYYERGLKYKCK